MTNHCTTGFETNLQDWIERSLSGEPFPKEWAQSALEDSGIDLLRLAAAAGDVRQALFGKTVRLHQINNIQNGLCPEDCGYCAQSKVSNSPVRKYPIKPEEELLREAHEAKANGAYRYCMVASGRGPTDHRVDELARVIRRIKDEVGIKTCLSAGIVSQKQALALKEAGLDRLNHNLNTSERHTPAIVNTHTYQDRINTLQNAQQAGLDLCSGVIAGMGETNDDLVDVAYTLRGLDVPSIPVNFLIPIEGNPVFDCNQLTPERCVRILCMFRFVNPCAEIRIGGGREGHIRSLQPLALYPANSLFIEGYLATRGDSCDKVYRMIEDAGFSIECEGFDRNAASTQMKFAIDGNADILNPKTTFAQGSVE